MGLTVVHQNTSLQSGPTGRRAVAGWVLYDLANTIFSIIRSGGAL